MAEGEKVAVKTLVGENHNVTFLRPVLARSVVEHVVEIGAAPTVVDTVSLWPGSRFDPQSLEETARRNGFSRETLGCPFEVADESGAANVHPKNSDIRTVEVARRIYDADALVVLSHVTLDDLGFGLIGALYNLGFGCTDRVGKARVFRGAKVSIDEKKCVACWSCVTVCRDGAVKVEDNAARLDESSCVRCGACVPRCPKDAISIRRDPRGSAFSLVETARAVLQSFKPGKVVFVNFLMDITPHSDELSYSDAPLVPSLGVAASMDPVALDAASSSMIRSAALIGDTPDHWKKTTRKSDLIKKVTGIEWRHVVRAAERVGMGGQRYKLVNV